MDASLGIEIKADTRDAVANVTNLENRIARLGQTFDVQNSALNQSVAFTRQLANADRDAAEGAKRFAEAQKLAAHATETATSSGGQFLNSTSKQRVALMDLGRIATGTGITVRSLGAQLTLFPGWGVAAVAAITLLVKKLYEYSEQTLTAEEISAKLSQTVAKGLSDEVGQTQLLVSTLMDGNTSRKQQKEIIDQLIQQHPNYFSNLLDTKDLQETLTDDLNKYIRALEEEARVKAAGTAITELVSEQMKNQISYTEDLVYWNKRYKADVGNQDAQALDLESIRLSAEELNRKNASIQEQINLYNTLGKAAIQKINDLGGPTDATAARVKQTKIQDENIQYLEKVKSLTESLSKKDSNPLFKDFAQSAEGELGKINLQIYQDNLKKATAAALKGSITGETFDEYTRALGAAFSKQANPNLLSFASNTGIEDHGLAKLEAGLNKQVEELGRHIRPIPLHLGEIGDQSQAISAEVQQIADNINQILSNSTKQGVINLASAIGGAIGSGQDVLQSAFQSLLSFLGDGIQEIGKQLIVIGAIAEVAAMAIKALLHNPALAIIAGIAFIAVGEVLKSKARNIHAFAEGGVVTGPTNALIGEAGTEVIFPLNKLNQFVKNIQGGVMQVAVTGNIQGNDIRLTQQRTANQQRFN